MILWAFQIYYYVEHVIIIITGLNRNSVVYATLPIQRLLWGRLIQGEENFTAARDGFSYTE